LTRFVSHCFTNFDLRLITCMLQWSVG
jgi:hypothetical protein